MRYDNFFTTQDLKKIKHMNLTPSDVNKQLKSYRRGPLYLKLTRPCSLGDGIRSFSSSERNHLIKYYNDQSSGYSLLKFVPASGAASRMFTTWFAAAENGGFGRAEMDKSFFADLRKMPFFSLLEKDNAVQLMLRKKNLKAVLNCLLISEGYRFGWLSKALLPFHVYPNNEIRTAMEEHLVEAASFIAGDKKICRLHFTISPEHKKIVKAFLRSAIPKYEKRCQVRFKIGLSVQSPATNIVAADERNLPFRDQNGCLVFRPGGHGALLKNLQALNADFIYVKNIDNIAPETLQKSILPYKKMLAGLAMQLQKTVFEMLRRLGKGQLNAREIKTIANFCRSEFNINIPKGFSRLTLKEKKQWIFSHLNRPLRVCGMVKNDGEPGGGPFRVKEKDGTQTLQIVESAHVNFKDKKQSAIWQRAKYFNPVDMVCCTKNYHGEKFDLSKYVNHNSYLITSKTEKGQQIKAQELPGLWNGGMAYWNTVFVEIPLIVFNPVKTVYDLLRPQHRVGRIVK